MAERNAYEPGTPCWVDVATPDTAAAATFYGSLFGWEAQDLGADAGGYGMFTLRGRQVAGFGPVADPAAPPAWSVYVAVADVDKTCPEIEKRGGTVVAGPMDVFTAGRMAVAQDAVGSYVSLWQPRDHSGAGLVNEPGAFTWSELSTTDIARARDFYTGVFNWGTEGDPGNDQAAIFTVGGRPICGAHAAGQGEFPAWSVWFSVEDCDAAAARVGSLGGSVLMPPNNMDFGRGAVVADPQHAAFGIGAVKPEMVEATG
jgi:predicted enzyme related to lactoylglutathione lyase